MKENNDIINHIKRMLQSHEYSYDDGAWERFAAKQKAAVRKSPVVALWKWTSAAAAVIIGIIVITRVFNTNNNTIPVPVANETTTNKLTPDSIITTDKSSKDLVIKPLFENIQSQKLSNHNIDKKYVATVPSSIKNEVSPEFYQLQQQPIAIPDTLSRNIPQIAKAPIIKEPQPQQPVVDFWKNKTVPNENPASQPQIKNDNKPLITTAHTAPNQERDIEKNRKWQPSLYVSPIFGDLGVNMGYGFSLGYAISDKIKISSGIAHTKISASRSFDADALGAVASASTGKNKPDENGPTGAIGNLSPSHVSLTETNKYLYANASIEGTNQISSLQQIDGSVSGIDIPLEINYAISKKIYATAGVSGLIVIDDNKKYTYLDIRNEKVAVQTNKGSSKENKPVLFSEQNITTQPLHPSNENAPFMGYYNLSMGFRQKISHTNAISIEPFIKVPMKNANQQNLNYKGTGIRLKFDF